MSLTSCLLKIKSLLILASHNCLMRTAQIGIIAYNKFYIQKLKKSRSLTGRLNAVPPELTCYNKYHRLSLLEANTSSPSNDGIRKSLLIIQLTTPGCISTTENYQVPAPLALSKFSVPTIPLHSF